VGEPAQSGRTTDVTDFEAFGPGLFDPEIIDPETLELNRHIEEQMTLAPARWEMTEEHERTLTPGGGLIPSSDPVPGLVEREVPGPGGTVPVRIIPCEGEPRGVYLHFHGGGFAMGGARHHDGMLAETAREAGVVTVSADYRLAPEHPYPAAPADSEAVAMWILQHGAAEFGTDRLVIGGESAGATLSAVTALRLRDRHGFTGLAGLNLSQGAYDMRMTPGVRQWGHRRLIINTPTIKKHYDRYLEAADREDPDVSALFADLTDMPPALFTVGTMDPLLEDSAFLYVRWVAAGNQAKLDVYPGGCHGFNYFPTELGRKAARRANEFIRERCASDAG
jgi:acetyl esterase